MISTDLSPEVGFAGGLAVPIPPLSHRQTCAEVFTLLCEQPDIPAAVVLDDAGNIAGLVNRLMFLARYARQYAPELYGRKSILKLAGLAPLVVDEHVAVGDLGATLLIENPGALIECFIVTSHGRYKGIGTGEALLRAKVSLAHAREYELSHALTAAHQSSKAKGDFLALTSHELRTPLNAIIGFSEVLGAQMFGPMGNARYLEYARDINGAGTHLLALINDILDLSKAEAGKFDLNCTEIATDGLILECLKLMRDRAQQSKLHLSPRLEADLPHLFVDRLRLKQVMLNLLSNAVKFTPPGGTVTVTARQDQQGRVVVAVEDTGIDMAAEMIPVALEPFRQIASPFARNVEGTGLGLSLVKSLIELHDGALEIDSKPNEGTVARLFFPATRVVPVKTAKSA